MWAGLFIMPRMPSPLIGEFPSYRPRRLRGSAALRRMVRETRLHADQLVLPLFVRPGRKVRNAVPSMPGVFQLSIDEVVREAAAAHKAGVPAVILFGIPPKKDERASGAYAKNGIVQKAVRKLKRELPGLLVMTDVCLCEYMSHGHCGLMKKKGGQVVIDNDPSLKLLARTAVSHAEAGADVVAPSDMMDGRVAAIRAALNLSGFDGTPIMSYAAKFASAYYGPFRDALNSAPKEGDKKTYQMDPANAREAIRGITLDEEEGADWLLIKPGLPYLDIIRLTREYSALPIAAYHVSGEYAMLKAAVEKGWLDYESCLIESLISLRRAGADMIFSYGAIDAAGFLQSFRG